MTRTDLADLRVLVVEDNSLQRRIVVKMLETLGAADVRQAGDGVEALAVLETFRPDIILTNCRMQPMGGLEFAGRLRAAADRPYQTVPVIMLSAEDEAAQAERARDTGINAFLTKPVLSAVLRDQILQLLKNPPPFVRSATYIGPDRRVSSTPYNGRDRRHAET